MEFRLGRKKWLNDWTMDELHKSTQQELAKAAAENNLSLEQESELEEGIQKLIPEFADEMLTSLKRNAPSMLKEHRKLRRGFAHRNYRRWKVGFDKLYMLIVMSEEMGQAIDNAIRPTAAENYKFEAISHLHGRGFLLAREILCLMMNGFPDGALGRWRTLHEIAVIATFLQKHDQVISEGYLLNRDVQAYKAAKQYQEYEVAANLTPFGEKEFLEIKAIRDAIIAEHPHLDGEWGWAKPVINKERVTFFDIEKDTGLDHWRPCYKWATQDTHGNHRPTDAMLALCEKNYEGLSFPAESNSGMTDPAHMMALSLILVTNAHVQLEPNIDRLVGLGAMRLLGDEIGETFLGLKRETMDAYLKRTAGIIGRIKAYMESEFPSFSTP